MDSQTYDMDWGSGTVWNGPLKLGSSAHCKDGAGTKTTASLVSAGLTFEPSLLLLALSGMRPSRAFQREQWPRRGECFTGDLASPQGARSVISTASWNLGGQPVDKLATAVPDVDVFLIQEAARDVEGWQESEDDTHFWLLHRKKHQWRGTGFGIAKEIFDSVVARKCTSRGVLALVKLKGRGRIAIGTLQAHAGVTNSVYQQAMDEFFQELGGKWKQYPVIVGTDLNEGVRWECHEDQPSRVGGTANLNFVLQRCSAFGLRSVAPPPTYKYALSSKG